MTVTVASFRANFMEFAAAAVYHENTINYWIGIANLLLNQTRWSDMLDHGTELFVAHHLVLSRQNTAAARNGGVPGLNTGSVASKSVDKVSISYTPSSTLDLKAGHWTISTYGVQFIHLARAVGSGGFQTGPGVPIGFSVF